MLDKIKNLKWHFQLLIMISLAALAYGGVYYFFTSETRAETAALNDQIAAQLAKNTAAKMATEHINEFRALYASKQQEYDELKVLLPEQREITNVLEGLQDTARSSRMTVMRFSPRDDSSQSGVMAKPVEVEVDSNFSNIRSFFESMAKLPRIVSITDFKINQLDKQSSDKTLHAQFLLTAYYAAPENPQPAKPGTPGAPATPGQPAAPGAAPAPAAAQPPAK